MNRTCDMCDRLFNENYMSWIKFINDYGEEVSYTLCNSCIEKLNTTGQEFFKFLEELENKNVYKNEYNRLTEPLKDIGYYVFVIILCALGLWFVMEKCF